MSFFRQFAALALAVCMGLVLVGCESGKTTAPGQPTLDAMIITPGTVDVPISGTRALRVTGSFSDSSSMDLTSTSTFASSAPGVAIVSPAGVVTAVS
ncbi:MAG: hypothetical protein IT483_00550, partial [Gammaproteobacteria bacterium]|nr:hypothetical protein [Gammaproteobacteria bacterium]